MNNKQYWIDRENQKLNKGIKDTYELGYSLNEAITMAINIAREVEISKYER